MSSAIAVMKTFQKYGYTPVGIGFAAIQAAIGLANIARVASTPIPQYAKGAGINGRPKHPGGLAIVGEQGVELGILPSGKTFLTPATDTLMDLPAQTKIIPHEKLMEGVYNIAFKKLANAEKVSTDSFATALIDSFESKLDLLIKETRKKEGANISIVGNFDHYMHVKNNIR